MLLRQCVYQPFILTKGVEIVLLGIELEKVDEILSNYYFINREHGMNLIKTIIIINGLLCI